jgi:hypothetical protein
LPQHPQRTPFSHENHGNGRCVLSATLPQRGSWCDTVAQRKFIRNAPATPNSMILIESCGAAAFSGGVDARRVESGFVGRTERWSRIFEQLIPVL